MITKQLLSLRLRFKTKVILSAVLPFCAVILYFSIRSDPPNEASDTITGNQDETCVGENAKVKDPVKPLYGTKATIVELTGKAPQCTQPAFPIHAVLTPISRVSPATAAKIKASFTLPGGWALLPLTDDLRDRGAFLYGLNPVTKARFIISAIRRESIDDMPEYAKANRVAQIDRLSDAHPSDIENLEINKLSAWRYVVRGTGRATHQDSTYLETIMDAENEVVLLNVWTPTPTFSGQEDELEKLAFNIKGLANQNNLSNPSSFTHQATGTQEKATSLFGFSSDSDDDNSDMTAFVPKGGVDLPPGYSKAKLSAQNKADGVFFSAMDKNSDGGVEMSSVARNAVDTVLKYVKTRIDTVVSNLLNPQQSDIEELEINGMQAWRFQVRGIDKVTHKDSTYLETVIDSGEKIVVVSTWAPSADFPSRKSELSGVAYSVKGADGVMANSARKPNSPDDAPFVSKATLDIPDGWIKATITEAYKLGGVVLYALNQSLDGGIIMSAVSQDTVSNMPKYAKLKLEAQTRNLTDAHASEISQLQINGLRAWRFQVQGIGKTSGKDYTYLITMIESKNEIVLFNVFVATDKFADHKEELGKLASYIQGLEMPTSMQRLDPVSTQSDTVTSSPAPARPAKPVAKKKDNTSN